MISKKKKGNIQSPRLKYKIEDLIPDSDGKLRPVRPEDFYIKNNPGVRDAFKLIYELQKSKFFDSERKEINKNTIGKLDKDQSFLKEVPPC